MSKQWFLCGGEVREGGLCGACDPVVVIDPEDREQVERLIDALANAERDKGRDYTEERSGVMEAALREFANPNPKPEEPLSPGAIAVSYTHLTLPTNREV